jgi:hypothetical protein
MDRSELLDAVCAAYDSQNTPGASAKVLPGASPTKRTARMIAAMTGLSDRESLFIHAQANALKELALKVASPDDVIEAWKQNDLVTRAAAMAAVISTAKLTTTSPSIRPRRGSIASPASRELHRIERELNRGCRPG